MKDLNNLFKAAVVCSLFLMDGAAQAASSTTGNTSSTYDLGTLLITPTELLSKPSSKVNVTDDTTFTDTWTFTVGNTGSYDFMGKFSDTGIKFTALSFLTTTSSTSQSDQFATFSGTYQLLAGNTYSIFINGENKNNGNGKGADKDYQFSYKLVSAVPEPEEWALLMVGLGIMGWRLHNVKKQRAETGFEALA